MSLSRPPMVDQGLLLIQNPELHIKPKEGYPLIHYWLPLNMGINARSWTIFQEFSNSDEKQKSYQVKQVIWKYWDFIDSNEPIIEVKQREVETTAFELLLEKAKQITVDLSQIRKAYPTGMHKGVRFYPFCEFRFNPGPQPKNFDLLLNWLSEFRGFLEAQLKEDFSIHG